jgi:hypothetical protein
MSITCLLQTGMTEREWELAWKKLPAHAKTIDLGVSFDEWTQAVIDEAKNRKFINYAVAGKRLSLREGVKQVIREIHEDHDQPTAQAVTA